MSKSLCKSVCKYLIGVKVSVIQYIFGKFVICLVDSASKSFGFKIQLYGQIFGIMLFFILSAFWICSNVPAGLELSFYYKLRKQKILL